MSLYTVYNTISGQELGVYEAESAEAAIEANYIDAGYAGRAGYVEQTGDKSECDLAAVCYPEQYSADFSKWARYIDPDGAYSREEFDAMPMEERVKIAAEVIAANA